MIAPLRTLRLTARELRELGPSRSLFRIRYELGLRAHALIQPLARLTERDVEFAVVPSLETWDHVAPFADAKRIADAVRDRVPARAVDALVSTARAACDGKILAFGRFVADYGDPIDWHRNPMNGHRWNPKAPWSAALADEASVGDVKLTWEIARFPHAYHLARAAALAPETVPEFAAALEEQILSFIASNPHLHGVHWASGQEIAFRLMSWLFAISTFERLGASFPRLSKGFFEHVHRSVVHVDDEIDYARHAVYNNHLLSEALALYIGARLLPSSRTETWERTAFDDMTRECERQFYRDGAYIQNAHNYHRVAVQDLLWLCAMRRHEGLEPHPAWMAALERSLDFLYAHQNEADGRLPNYGSNDGALPTILSTCDFSDFRPTLQAVSAFTRGERLYDAGPWDEAMVWWCGPEAVELPLRGRPRRSVSFADSGYHVLRGDEPSTFAAFRCGTIADRFSQIDMLHLDVWWRGENIALDAGSYLYNGPHEWHAHFMRTGSHNTVTIDGADQMLHWRRFKCLYWTRAQLLGFEDADRHVLCSGEHYGYERLDSPAVHRRSVLMWKQGVWVVLDTIRGAGSHDVRLHWLLGDFPHDYRDGAVSLRTPAGSFDVAVYGLDGRPLLGDVVRGRSSPPRGWLARYYAEHTPTPSLAVEQRGEAVSFLTVLSPRAALARTADGFAIDLGGEQLKFTAEDGLLHPLP